MQIAWQRNAYISVSVLVALSISIGSALAADETASPAQPTPATPPSKPAAPAATPPQQPATSQSSAPAAASSTKPAVAVPMSPERPAVPPGGSASPASPQLKPPLAPAATGTAIVQGRVTDAEIGTAIGDAEVLLTKVGKDSLRFEQEVQDDGSFSFKNLEDGDWELTVTADGMFSQNKRIKVIKGQTTDLGKIAMEELESTDVLRVSGKRTLIHPDRIGSTTDLDRRFLNQFKSGNDLKTVIESTPGVMADSFGNIITRGEHNAVNYELDGVVLPEAPNALSQGQFANPRALQSVSVDIGGYEARDGGGPLGAIARLKTLPIQSKPTFEYGGQIGGPIGGSLYYRSTGAFSQNPNSKLNRLRYESVGTVTSNSYGIQAPVKHYARNARIDMNFMNKLEYAADEYNTFKLTASLNSTFAQQPTSLLSRLAGVRQTLTERNHYVIASWNRKGRKWFDEANLHFVNAFYQQVGQSNLAFDPAPNLVGEEPFIASTAFTGRRFNYAFSAQGDIRKRVFKTHNLQAGFLSEVRPVTTSYSGVYYNTNRDLSVISLQDSLGNIEAGLPLDNVPFGGLISPFTRTTNGPQFTGNIGKYKGFRYLQSAYFQDTWKPDKGFLKRLTLNAGARVDVYHGVFGNTLGVANAMAQIPGIQPFDISPFNTQRVTDAQVSGRYGGTFALTRSTVLRASYSNIFQPPPVDVFVTPPNVSESPVGGIYNGTVRPLSATRGQLVDASIEQQIGPRFVVRNNLYYKKLKNFGDSGVVQNTPLYNRLTLSGQEAYGCETRMELRPSKDGTGFNGFVSNTVAVAYLRGSKGTTGGIYEAEEEPVTARYPDHDRRYALNTGLGYRWKSGLWTLGECSYLSGLPNGLDPAIYGFQNTRTPKVLLLGLNAGYDMPKKIQERSRLIPTSFDVRIDNLLNQRTPLNLGSPFQGNRFMLPIRVLAGMYWKV